MLPPCFHPAIYMNVATVLPSTMHPTRVILLPFPLAARPAYAVRPCTLVLQVSVRHSRLSTDAIASICQHLGPRLRSLDLHGTRGFDDGALRAVAAHCARLHTLKVGECVVSDFGIRAVATRCPELRHLELSLSPLVTSEGSLSRLHAACEVRWIQVVGCGVSVKAKQAGRRGPSLGRSRLFLRLVGLPRVLPERWGTPAPTAGPSWDELIPVPQRLP